jgi:hypothetical protein
VVSQKGRPRRFEKIKLLAVDANNVDYGYSPQYDHDDDDHHDRDGKGDGKGDWKGPKKTSGWGPKQE